MGFGKKTDYPTGRVLDLDKSYRTIIKPAAMAAGLECTRADEIIHSGTIDVPMYERLLTADVVIADLSTYNCNAFYELGVRHALRPYTTITIAEDKMIFPFDLNHIAIRTYKHLGEGIDFEEVERMRAELQKAITTIANQPVNDSPVYQFLKDLKVSVAAQEKALAAQAEAAGEGKPETISVYLQMAGDAMAEDDFVTARAVLSKARKLAPNDPYVLQKLALATYKSRQPDAKGALKDAEAVLLQLNPEVSTDPETLGLWGAIHKRLWDISKDPADLESAIRAHEKAFYVRQDYYNGINLAYLLNLRGAHSADVEEAVGDFVLAQRARRSVIRICESAAPDYWVLATLAEAWFGLGEKAKSQEYLDRAAALNPAPAQWMKDSTAEQLGRLEKLLAVSPLERLRRGKMGESQLPS